MYYLDGKGIEVRRSLVPDQADRETVDRGFAILCLAACECAARHADELDLGEEDGPELRAKWQGLVSLLLDMAHWATPEAGEREDYIHLDEFFDYLEDPYGNRY